MKKIFVSNFPIMVVFLLLFFSLNSYALDYTINFSGKNVSDMVDSVIVQNMTQGTTVTVPAGNELNLKNVVTSIDQLSGNGQTLRIYPNPARDKSIVLFFAKKSGSTQINVFGIDGKKLVEICKDLPAGENSFQLSLPKGIYAIRIAGNGFSYASKVIGQAYAINKPIIDFIGNKETEALISSKLKNSIKLKNSSATTMLYSEGDHLLFKGVSENCKTIVTDIPTQSKTITFNFVDCTDADNNHYTVVQIGTQVWMVENLNTTKYRNGEFIDTTIPLYKDIMNESEPKYQWAYNGDKRNASKFGRLYTWYAENDSRNLTPVGWHVPSDAEWTTLENYLIANGYSNDNTSADKIAQSLAATTDWNFYTSLSSCIGKNLKINNTSGFSAMPGGYRFFYGTFTNIGNHGLWWSATETDTSIAWIRYLDYAHNSLGRRFNTKNWGLSVRCVKD